MNTIKAKHKITGKIRSVKVINKKKMSITDMNIFNKELSILKKFVM